jgi:nucleoside 2-deoxyribosyltransferase
MTEADPKSHKKKKILMIGSTQYAKSMQTYGVQLALKGHEPRIPFLDNDCDKAIDIMNGNLELIKWADEIHLFWSQRTLGTLLDIGMAFALGKPIKVAYYEKKTIMEFLFDYEKLGSFW